MTDQTAASVGAAIARDLDPDDVTPAVASLETIVSLSKRRGFIFPSSEIYGGINAVWDYGPLGVELKNNVKRAWWRSMVQERDDIVGLDAGILMHPQVWVTSGHVGSFSDPLVECGSCHRRYRLDELPGAEDLTATDLSDPTVIERFRLICPNDGGPLSPPRRFNLMFQTYMGPVQDEASIVYFRPETAQGSYVNFKNVQQSSTQEDPLRHRPDRQVVPQRDQPRQLRLPDARVRADGDAVLRAPGTRLPTSSRPGCRAASPGTSSTASPPSACAPASTRPTSWRITPRRPSMSSIASRSAGRSSRASTIAATSTSATMPEPRARTWSTSTPRPRSTSSPGSSRPLPAPTGPPSPSSSTPIARRRCKGETRVSLALHPELAPYKVAVLPLLKKRPEIVELCHRIKDDLKRDTMAVYDDTAAIGKLYRRQDEIGTPWCVTVDVDSLDDGQVTIRDRDSMTQERVAADQVKAIILQRLAAAHG